MPKNDQGNVVPLDQIQQDARAGNGGNSIDLHWINKPIIGKDGLPSNSVNSQKDLTGRESRHDYQINSRREV